MRKKPQIPRILKIQKIDGFKVICLFNNGESRMIDFSKLFEEWKITRDDVEYPLLQESEFKKLQLRNYTLSWENIQVELLNENSNKQLHSYEIDPIVLFQNSTKHEDNETSMFGSIIRRARKKAVFLLANYQSLPLGRTPPMQTRSPYRQ